MHFYLMRLLIVAAILLTPKLTFIALPPLSFNNPHLNMFTNMFTVLLFKFYCLFSVSVHTDHTFTPLNLLGVPNKLYWGQNCFIITLY